MAESESFAVAGIGASAGGVEALEAFFREIPADSGLAYVVVTHLGPDHVSLLPEIIARATTLPVAPIDDGQAVIPDHVYVLAPRGIVTFADGRLRLRDIAAAQRERNPIDLFFASLAEDRHEWAVGVVLSGAGSDGTLGIKAIKEHGGLAAAQGVDGSRPRYSSMPESAIASGLVDIVAPVEKLPAKLIAYARSLGGLSSLITANDREAEQTAASRLAVCQILRNRTGHDFSGYKPATMLRRMWRRMKVLQLDSLEQYVQRLREDTDEAPLLFRDLLIGVTSFFRDLDAFEALRKVIPQLFEGRGAGDTVRAWVAGCSTGEEAYSIAILLREHMDTLAAVPRVQVFATDIDDPALNVARNGRYPAALLGDVTPERLARFFVKDGESYAPVKAVREMCVFSNHSIVRDPPFSRMDLISCRNLLIYFGGDLQKQVIPLFHYALRPGGILFLGGSEHVTQHADLFRPLDKKQRVFERREHAAAPGHFSLPAASRSALFSTPGSPRSQRSDASLRTSLEAHDVSLQELIRVEIEPFALADRKRVSMQGPPVQLTAKAAMGIGLAIHEFATNAVKYGALSQAHGTVEIAWSLMAKDERQHLLLEWSEKDGPQVTTPTRQGFGSKLIEQQIEYGLGGKVDIRYSPQGVRARLEVPLRDAAAPGTDAA
jgi:two-component system CheB/CheR fusion protein